VAQDKNKIGIVLEMLDKATAPLKQFADKASATMQSFSGKASAAIGKATEPLNRFNKKVEGMTGPIKESMKAFGEATGIPKLKKSLGDVGDGFKKVGSEAFGLFKKVAGAASAVGGAIFVLAKNAAGYGDQMLKASQRAGVNVVEFQKLAYAAEQGGSSVEELEGSLIKLSKGMVDAQGGSKEMQKWFGRAGISMDDLKKMSPEQVFHRVSDAIQKLPDDSPRRAALAMGLFGKSGAKLLPMLQDGSAGLREMGAEAERLGKVIDAQKAAEGTAFSGELTRLTSTVKGVALSIGFELLPLVHEVVASIREWIGENSTLMKSKVAEWIASLREHWPAVKQGALDAFGAVRNIIDFVSGAIDRVGGFGNALKILAGVVSAKLIFAVAGLGKALVALGWTMMTTPIGWFLGAVALLGGAVYLIYKNWEPIKNFFSRLWGGIKDALSATWELIKGVLRFTPLGIIIDNWEPVKEWLGLLWEGIKVVFGTAWDAIKWICLKFTPLGIIIDRWEPIRNYFTELWDSIKSIVSGAWDWMSKKLGGLIKFLGKLSDAKKEFNQSVGRMLFGNKKDADRQPSSDSGSDAWPTPSGVPTGAAANVRQAVQSAGMQSRVSMQDVVRTNNAAVTVDFKNVPRGAAVMPGRNNSAELNLNMGYATAFGS